MRDAATPVHPDEPQSPGAVLAAARQARGMTVTAVAERLKFSPRQIEALEAGHYDALQGPAMVRGMIRAYARLIGAEPDPLLAALHERLNAGPLTMQPPALEVPFARASPRTSRVYVLLSAIVVIAVVSVIAEWALRPGTTVKSTSAPQTAPTVSRHSGPLPPREALPTSPLADADSATTATSAQSPLALEQRLPMQHETVLHAKRIELVFDRESWVEIRDADGRVVFSQLNPAGSRRDVVGEAPFSIIIGNATGVKLRYNDADVDLAPFTRTHVARLTLK